MARDKIEIKLTNDGKRRVELDDMSIEALESFISVTNSLKNIAESVTRDVTFTLRKGSACAAVRGYDADIRDIYAVMNEAIVGESEDEIVTENMRSIQSQLKKIGFNYQFYYADDNLKERIVKAKKITKKRVKIEYSEKLEVITGYFNSVGGDEPNYHFDYGERSKRIISCSRSDVQELKDYFYKDISCLVLKKFNEEYEDKTVYTHCSLLLGDQVSLFKGFLKKLDGCQNLFDRLECIYDFVDQSNNRVEDLKVLLRSSNYFFNDINEIKTLLIITRGLSSHKEIQLHRERLKVSLGKELNYF